MATPSKEIKIMKPVDWGNDELTKFIDMTNENSLATFANMQKEFGKLIEIDKLFHVAIDCAQHSREYFPALFILKSHSAFLASAKLAVGTQSVESYMTMRGVIECALYGYYIFRNKEYARVWLDRDTDEEHRKDVRKKFIIGDIFRTLEGDDGEIASIARSLYDQTIEYGAHPNEKSLSTVLNIVKEGKNINLNLEYLTSKPNAIKCSLVVLARIGIISLKISEHILPERFKIIGLTDKIGIASRGL